MCGQVDGDCAHRAAPLPTLGRQRTYISPTNLFELLPVVMQFSVFCFSIGAFFAMFVSNSPGTWTVGIVTFIGILYWWAGYWIVRDSYTPFTLSRRPVLKMIRTWTEYTRRSMHEKVLNRDDAHVAILNRLFTHTSMTPNNSSILIQLFSLPVEYPQIRTKSLAPWSALSSLLPSMLMEMYSHPGCNLLPVLRLSLTEVSRSSCWSTKKRRERTAPSRPPPPIHYKICTYTSYSRNYMLLPETRTTGRTRVEPWCVWSTVQSIHRSWCGLSTPYSYIRYGSKRISQRASLSSFEEWSFISPNAPVMSIMETSCELL